MNENRKETNKETFTHRRYHSDSKQDLVQKAISHDNGIQRSACSSSRQKNNN
jgi:hypothetical protein